MKVIIITLFPEMFAAITRSGITSRAVDDQLVDISFINPRDFTSDKHQTVDDRPYGGGPGMVMKVEPLAAAVEAALAEFDQDRSGVQVIYLSPQGQQLSNDAVDSLLVVDNFVMICGRYEGVDERFIDEFVDAEWSIGDYVLSGGELPAMVMLDALIRKLPGALGDEQSAVQDSFQDGLLDCQHYTRPLHSRGRSVPEILLSGDHEKIRQWRLEQSLRRTRQRRPDLLDQLELTEEQQCILQSIESTDRMS